jgi:hypothetical protein
MIGSGTPAGGVGVSATKHMIDGCLVAVRIDVSKLVGNPSFQAEIVPTLDAMLATAAPKEKDFAEFQTFLKDTGVDYKKSINDVVICVSDIKDANHKYAVIVGGSMKPDTVAEALAKSDKKGTLEDLDGHKVLVEPNAVIGQAPDGVVIVAGDKDMFKKISSSTGAASSPLDGSKYLSFSLNEQAVSTMMAGAGKKAEPFAMVKKANGFVDLDAPKIELVADCGTPDDAKKLDSLVTLMKDELVKKADSAPPGVADSLKAMTSHMDGSNVVIDIAAPKDALDKGMKALGDLLKKEKEKI